MHWEAVEADCTANSPKNLLEEVAVSVLAVQVYMIHSEWYRCMIHWCVWYRCICYTVWYIVHDIAVVTAAFQSAIGISNGDVRQKMLQTIRIVWLVATLGLIESDKFIHQRWSSKTYLISIFRRPLAIVISKHTFRNTDDAVNRRNWWIELCGCSERILWDKAVLRTLRKDWALLLFDRTAFDGKKRIFEGRGSKQTGIKRASNENQITFDTNAKGCPLIYIRFSPLSVDQLRRPSSWRLVLSPQSLAAIWLPPWNPSRARFLSALYAVREVLQARCVGQPIDGVCANGACDRMQPPATVSKGFATVPIKIWNSLSLSLNHDL